MTDDIKTEAETEAKAAVLLELTGHNRSDL